LTEQNPLSRERVFYRQAERLSITDARAFKKKEPQASRAGWLLLAWIAPKCPADPGRGNNIRTKASYLHPLRTARKTKKLAIKTTIHGSRVLSPDRPKRTITVNPNGTNQFPSWKLVRFYRLSAAIHCLFKRVLTIFSQIPLVEDCEFTSESDRTLPIRLTEVDYVKSAF
jgi:hypothetical protein